MTKVKLQLFAEPVTAAPAAEATPAPAAAQPAASTDQQVKALWDKANTPQEQNQPKAVDNPAPQAPEKPENPATQAQPVKYLNKYDTLEDFEKAHKSLQTSWNKDHTALLESNKIVDQLKAEKESLESRLQELAQPQAQPEDQPTGEFEGLEADAVLEKLYSDPWGTVRKMAEIVADSKLKAIEDKIAPVIERNTEQKVRDQWGEAVNAFSETNPDVSEFTEGMSQYIAENNLRNSPNIEKVLQDAYIYAKGLKYSAPVKPEELLSDESFVNQILSDPNIQEKFKKQYIASVREQQNQIPNTIAGQNNNGSTVMPPLELKGKPMSDVHKAASDFLFGAR